MSCHFREGPRGKPLAHFPDALRIDERPGAGKGRCPVWVATVPRPKGMRETAVPGTQKERITRTRPPSRKGTATWPWRVRIPSSLCSLPWIPSWAPQNQVRLKGRGQGACFPGLLGKQQKSREWVWVARRKDQFSFNYEQSQVSLPALPEPGVKSCWLPYPLLRVLERPLIMSLGRKASLRNG